MARGVGPDRRGTPRRGAALAGFHGPLPDDWLQLPLTTAAVHAAARVGDVRFLRRHLPLLEPLANRFAFVGEGGLLRPVVFAVAVAHLVLDDAVSRRRHAERALTLAQQMDAVRWLPVPGSSWTCCRRRSSVSIVLQSSCRKLPPWIPDLSFDTFAIHQAQRDAVDRYRHAVATLAEHERTDRGKALTRWAKGFAVELEEHHYTEDSFFFPSLRSRVPSATATLDDLAADHRSLDELIACWPTTARALADRTVPFGDARAEAIALASELHDLLHRHLAVEDGDILPLFWRHYTAADYDQVFRQAVKKSKKAGMWFIAPFTVDCYAPAPSATPSSPPSRGILRLIHRRTPGLRPPHHGGVRFGPHNLVDPRDAMTEVAGRPRPASSPRSVSGVTVADRLRPLGIVLPPVFPPAGSYVGCVVDGDLVHVGGHGPTDGTTRGHRQGRRRRHPRRGSAGRPPHRPVDPRHPPAPSSAASTGSSASSRCSGWSTWRPASTRRPP